MTPIAEQLAKLKQSYPAATGTALPSGAFLVDVPDYKLPAGWNRDIVTVSFLAPVGYPAARPDCFWVDQPFLRLANGQAVPQASNEQNPIPEVGLRGTWFSWHVQSWDPNKDSLLTYLNVIKRRLETVA